MLLENEVNWGETELRDGKRFLELLLEFLDPAMPECSP